MTHAHICLLLALISFALAAGKVPGLSWRDAGFAFAVLSLLLG